MKKTQIKVPKGFIIDAYLIKEYLTLEIGLEQETWLHQILYCQNRLIEYTKKAMISIMAIIFSVLIIASSILLYYHFSY